LHFAGCGDQTILMDSFNESGVFHILIV